MTPSLLKTETSLPAYCRKSLQQLERRKAGMLAVVEAWPQDWLDYAPKPQGWSTLQLLTHLVLTERAVRLSCERNLTEQMSPTSAERWRAELLLLAFRFPIRVRIPGAVAFLEPVAPPPLRELIEEWDLERRSLLDLLRSQGNRCRYWIAMQHPATGALSLETAMRFLAVHIWHHEYQLVRLRRTVARGLPH